MIIDVAFIPRDAQRWQKPVCIVVDVLRATTTLVTLFEQGIKEVLVAGEVDTARELAQQYKYLLIGERNGLRVAGFDFGNSPTALLDAKIAGKGAVLTTSNGTVALRSLPHAPVVCAGCLRNATASCEKALDAAQQYNGTLCIVCAGRGGSFVMDDSVCAGYMVAASMKILEKQGLPIECTDAALAARRLYYSYPDIPAAFKDSDSGRRVIEIGQAADLEFCAQIDVSRQVPVLQPGEPLRVQ
ncbi:MAG: 2-phosphosulfolactate phosphatase [Anaerolineae bacterium]|nr:2-phosphosulfolactate phosphatase [Anaerolineae bacterium]